MADLSTVKSRGGPKAEKALRWTINVASREFGMGPKQLVDRLRKLGFEAGSDSMYTTHQICCAKYGDYDSERARKMAAEADAREINNKVVSNQYIDINDVMDAWAEIMSNVKQKILASELPRPRQDAILVELKEIFTSNMVSDKLAIKRGPKPKRKEH